MLLFSTGNIIVAILNVITIIAVLTSVTGLIYMIGWKLGVTESLGVDLFVGFSVDYIVHVGCHYVHSY